LYDEGTTRTLSDAGIVHQVIENINKAVTAAVPVLCVVFIVTLSWSCTQKHLMQ
jgi:hypothetical protein